MQRNFLRISKSLHSVNIFFTDIIKAKKKLMNNESFNKKSKPPYLIGLLCLIPIFGAFVGLGLLLYGVIKYKDKLLSIIGVIGIAWSIIIYSLLFYQVKYSKSFKNGREGITQLHLNSLVKNIEFYKLEHGQYPDSLQQVLDEDKLATVYDLIQSTPNSSEMFTYKKMGKKYLLFSTGLDGISNTKDDLYPQIIINDSSKIGLILTTNH